MATKSIYKPIAKVIAKESTIPSLSKGLFSTVDISKGSTIVEYGGKLKNLAKKLAITEVMYVFVIIIY